MNPAARVLCLVFVLRPYPAAAAPERRIAVIATAVSADPELNWTAERLETELVRLLDFAVGLSVAKDLQPESRGEIDLCRSNGPCLAGVMEKNRIDLLLSAIGLFSTSPPTLSLRLMESRAAKPRVAVVQLGTREDVEELGRRAGQLLAETGTELGGRIDVRTQPPGATVTAIRVAGPALGAPSAELDVPRQGVALVPGTYRVRAALDGYSGQEIEVTVEKAKRLDLSLELEPQPSVFESPWLWMAAGAAIAGGLAAAVVLTSAQECICVGPVKDECRACP